METLLSQLRLEKVAAAKRTPQSQKPACGKCGRKDWIDMRGRLCNRCAFPENYRKDGKRKTLLERQKAKTAGKRGLLKALTGGAVLGGVAMYGMGKAQERRAERRGQAFDKAITADNERRGRNAKKPSLIGPFRKKKKYEGTDPDLISWKEALRPGAVLSPRMKRDEAYRKSVLDYKNKVAAGREPMTRSQLKQFLKNTAVIGGSAALGGGAAWATRRALIGKLSRLPPGKKRDALRVLPYALGLGTAAGGALMTSRNRTRDNLIRKAGLKPDFRTKKLPNA